MALSHWRLYSRGFLNSSLASMTNNCTCHDVFFSAKLKKLFTLADKFQIEAAKSFYFAIFLFLLLVSRRLFLDETTSIMKWNSLKIELSVLYSSEWKVRSSRHWIKSCDVAVSSWWSWEKCEIFWHRVVRCIIKIFWETPSLEFHYYDSFLEFVGARTISFIASSAVSTKPTVRMEWHFFSARITFVCFRQNWRFRCF